MRVVLGYFKASCEAGDGYFDDYTSSREGWGPTEVSLTLSMDQLRRTPNESGVWGFISRSVLPPEPFFYVSYFIRVRFFVGAQFNQLINLRSTQNYENYGKRAENESHDSSCPLPLLL